MYGLCNKCKPVKKAILLLSSYRVVNELLMQWNCHLKIVNFASPTESLT